MSRRDKFVAWALLVDVFHILLTGESIFNEYGPEDAKLLFEQDVDPKKAAITLMAKDIRIRN